MRRTEVYERPKKGDSFIVMEFIELQVRCSAKLFPAFNIQQTRKIKTPISRPKSFKPVQEAPK